MTAKQKAKAMKIQTTIRELPSGWLWKERGTIFKNAKSVIKALQKEDRASLVSKASVVIRTTNWETTTTQGRAIVKFLIA